MPMHLSIIIPAFNEESLITQCLKSVTDSLAVNRSAGFSYEIIVVDNNSTDNTAKLSKRQHARVVFEPVNHIGRARNAGAAAATGDWLLFVDADSLLNPGMITDILQMIESGKYVPSTVLALKLARVFEKPIEAIFQLEESD